MELIAVIIIIAAVVALEALLFGKYALKGIHYAATVNKNEVYEGDVIELTEVVENRRLIALPWIKTELSASRWLAFFKKDSAAQTLNSENSFIPGVFTLKPRSKCTRVRKIKCIKRGVFSFDNTIITATDILGLVRVTQSVPVNISVTVLPTASDGKDAVLSFNEPIGEISVKRFINEDPFIISGSREYTGREPLNRINWNYTASQNKLIVCNNEYSTSRTALIIMNMQRKGVVPVTCTNIRDIEAFIKLSVKLMWDCVYSGCTAAFVTNGGGKSGTATNMIRTNEGCENALRTLAQLENNCEYDFAEFTENINMGIFTDVFVLTSYIDDFMLEFADKKRRDGINVIFYTTGNIPEAVGDYQFIEASRFTFKWNIEEAS